MKETKYTCSPVSYKAPNKKGEGTLGLKLEYNETRNRLVAIVKGIKVELVSTGEGIEVKKASREVTGFSNHSDNAFVNTKAYTDFSQVKTYLCERYNIGNRKYDFLVNLAKEGKALLTKKEMKAQFKAFVQGE